MPLDMLRRDFLAASLAATAAGLAAPALNGRKRPHLFLVMTDQQRFDTLGCMGNKAIRTPNLDALAKDGVVFTHGYCSTPSCTPARAGLLTGQSPWHHGMLGYGKVAKSYPVELPRLLAEGGYHTFGIGKMHYAPQRALHGFRGTLLDESGRIESPDFVSDYRQWFRQTAPHLDPDATGIGWNDHRAAPYALPANLHPTRWTSQTAIDYVEHYRGEEPLFLKVSFARPHSPYDPPKPFWDMYRDEDMPEPALGDWAARFADHPGKQAPDAAFGDFGPDHVRRSRRGYYGAISFIDAHIGRFLAALKRKGIYDDSLILFTSDHGDMMGDHHHWRKTYAFEGSSHIPFIVKWPKGMEAGLKRGSRLDGPVELRDVLPTFLDAAGVPIPPAVDGRSLLDRVRQPKGPWREWIDLEHSLTYEPQNDWCGLTDGRVKYVFFRRDGAEMLFDLVKDPGETRNLAGQPGEADRLALWRGRMAEHLAERGGDWAHEGRPLPRAKSQVYSLHYPK